MDAIYDEYYFKIYYWALKKTNNKEDAEDLTSSVFLAIFEYFGKNVSIHKLDNLIWKIASNLWSARAKRYEKVLVSYDETSDVGYEENLLSKVIYKEIMNNLDQIGLTEKNIYHLKCIMLLTFRLKKLVIS